jgi:hypothetical protein
MAASLRLLWLLAVLVVGSAILATISIIAGHMTSGETISRAVPVTQLRDIAREAAPVVATLEAYKKDRGVYPSKPSDLEGRLTHEILADIADDGISFDTGGGAIWVYSRDDDGKGFDLERHLNEGGILTLSIDASGKLWSYAASDGEEAKTVVLDQ